MTRIASLLLACACLALTGCEQYVARSFGGTTKYSLPAGAQLVSMTWKDSDLWVLYYLPDTGKCVFAESSAIGMLEGSVILEKCNPVALNTGSLNSAR